MILVSILTNCDHCGETGNGIGAHRWLPGEHLQRPDLPKGWQLVQLENGPWELYCPNCRLMRGATK